MIIEKITNNKLKITFYSEDLEENNISVHSFLSSSFCSKKFVYSILEIAKNEFDFNLENLPLVLETISFNNTKFIIYVTKNYYNNIESINSVNSNTHQSYNTIFKFLDFNSLMDFSHYINNLISLKKINTSLYYLNKVFYLKLSFNDMSILQYNNFLCISSEFTNSIKVSNIILNYLQEHADIVIANNVIEKLL